MTARVADRPRVVIVDDDETSRLLLAEVLVEADAEVLESADGEVGWVTLVRQEAHLVVTDLRAPRVDGMRLLARIRDERANVLVVMLTARDAPGEAAHALELGAYDCLEKPLTVYKVQAVLRRATERVRLDLHGRRLAAELALARHLVFRSPAMSSVARLVERAAQRDVTVLISGDAGTGKELVADALIAASTRAAEPTVKFDCAAASRSRAEAELFGHSAGARGGAGRARRGLFREADGGTVLLDEVGELLLPLQERVLRVLQDGEVRAFGEERSRAVDVRVVATSQRDLKRLVREGRFREDLYQRLNVISVHLPSLVERPEDFDPLIDHFVRHHARRRGISAPRVDEALRSTLASRPWPGNVRELEDTLERLVARCRGAVLTVKHLGEALAEVKAERGLRERVEAFERNLLRYELERCGGNRSETARRLQVGRVTLLDKIKKYGL